MRRPSNPLEPLASTTALLVVVLGAGLVVGVWQALSGTGGLAGIGARPICVDEAVLFGAEPPPVSLHEPRPGVTTMGLGTRYCTDTPDPTMRLWSTMATLPSTLLLTVVVVILGRLVSVAGRDGIYTAGTVRRLRLIGWSLIVGPILVSYLESAASARLLARMVTDDVGGYFMPNGGAIWGPLLLVGIGVLTFARIVRLGCDMRDEIEATV